MLKKPTKCNKNDPAKHPIYREPKNITLTIKEEEATS